MSDTKDVLLVGCCHYEDSQNFPPLTAPAQDIEKLRRVLEDPEIGGFTARALHNESWETVRAQIFDFFDNRKLDDLLVLYFSGHGVLDADGQLYLATADTVRNQLPKNGIEARWVKERMDKSRSRRIVVLLDCCHSGAFPNGLTRSGEDITTRLAQQFTGRGRFVITAAEKMQVAHNVFTDAVVRGLETGAADLDGDGWISVDELYDYVSDQVLRKKPDQTPTMSVDRKVGKLILAKNCTPLLPLPDKIQQALESEDTWQQSWAIGSLRYLLTGDNPGGQKREARRVLEGLCEGGNLRIREEASKALGIAPDPPPPLVSVPELPPSDPPRRRARIYWFTGVVLVLLALLLVAILIPTLIPFSKPPAPNTPPSGPVPCAQSTNRPADGVLSFGTLLPKTGTFVYSGPAQEAAAQLAVKDINDAGGIPGVIVKLDGANQRDEGNPAGNTAIQSVDALLAGGVDVVIGPATSEVAGKLMDKVTCQGVIMFGTANTSTELTKRNDHNLYFRTTPLSTFEGLVLGQQIVKKDGKSKVVLMSRAGLFGDSLRDQTQKTILESGGQVLDSFSYDPGTLDYKKEIQRVKNWDPDAIVLIGFSESAQILTSMIEEGIGPRNKRVYLAGAYMTNTLVGQASPRDPGALAGMRGAPLDIGGAEFAARLRQASPGLQDLTYAPQAYDAVVITALAAAIARTDQASAIAREIDGVTTLGERCTSFPACMALVKQGKDIDYDGPSGRLEFSTPGEPTEGTYVISEIQADGTVKAIETVVCKLSAGNPARATC